MTSMSSAMAAGLNSLLTVNSELSVFQQQAATGKRINSASDGLAAFLSASAYGVRAGQIQSINDGLTSVSSTISAASNGLSKIRSLLMDTRNTLKAASETQGLQAAQGAKQLLDTDADNTQVQFQLQARFGKGANNAYGFQQTINDNTLLAQHEDKKQSSATQSMVFIGGQAMREGMTIKLNAGGEAGSTWTFKIGGTQTDATTGQPKDNAIGVDAANKTSTVYTVGQLLSEITNRIGVSLNQAVNGATNTVTMTYNGAGYGTDTNGNMDKNKALGLKVAVNYAKDADNTVDSNGAAKVYDAQKTVDVNNNEGYFNASAMFTSARAANKNMQSYIEDAVTTYTVSATTTTTGNNNQQTTTTGPKTITVAPPQNGKFVYDSTSVNGSFFTAAAAPTEQVLSFSGTQHNFQAAITAQKADVSRINAAKSYRLAMQSINSLVQDASVSGINLLFGASLKATLNEDGSGQVFQLQGANNNASSYTAMALGLVDAGGTSVDALNNFQQNFDNGQNGAGLMTAIDKIDAAVQSIDLGNSQLAVFTNVVTGRKDFNSSMIKMLNQAVSDLTAADMTEVATKTSALQVQQNFAQSILSSTKQSDQALIQLLR